MPTPFQEKVYEAARCIPRGRVVSYAALGDAIGCRSPRAVGQALRANPYAPEVPCHRVVAANRGPGGFFGDRAGAAIARKIDLLRAEGVEFDADGRVAVGAMLAAVP